MDKINKHFTVRNIFVVSMVMMWIKNMFIYSNFNLGVNGIFQKFILLLNPIPIILILLSIPFFIFKSEKWLIRGLILINLIFTVFLLSNLLYYREFTDFLSADTILGSKSISSNLIGSTLKMMDFSMVLYLVDIIILFVSTFFISFNKVKFRFKYGFRTLIIGFLLVIVNIGLAEIDRPQLLTRTFDKNYMVKYLGLNGYLVTDFINSYNSEIIRADATKENLDEILPYMEALKTSKNELTGVSKGNNVMYIHLESFQQFLINYKLVDSDGKEHEVSPFINSLFNNKDTLSFENAFHQVAQGKTSDSETIIENSLFGLAEGSVMVKYGSKNTFNSAPNIYNGYGYDSASLHGNIGSFWNRDNAYKSFGYKHFYDSSWYDLDEENTLEYGLKDEFFLSDSVKYIKDLKKPFYAKLITVSNHFPYVMEEEDNDFPLAETSDNTINGYFRTANYLDKELEKFFETLKKEDLYENTTFVLYGDHYGISNSRNKELAELIGEDKELWNKFNNSNMQRIPLMFHIPNYGKGKVVDKYVGQIDILPTLNNIMGIDDNNYIGLGKDAFSKEHDNFVIFRNGDVITDKFHILGKDIFDKEGKLLDKEIMTEKELEYYSKYSEIAREKLDLSDKIIKEDLLRFYTPKDFTPTPKEDIEYRNLEESQ